MADGLLWHFLLAGITVAVGLVLEVLVIRFAGPPERD